MSINGSLGAYDLSAFQKNDNAQGVPGGDPGQATPDAGGQSVAGPYVVELTAYNLQTVVEVSSKLPVVVAFHSAHSENSAKLLDSLKRLVFSKGGRFQLATVNTDESPDVAQAFGAQAVPAAVALLQGQPVPLFQGLPDEAQLAETVDKVILAGEQYGLTSVLDGGEVPAEPEIPPLHKAGLEALERGDLDAAHTAYTDALAQNPGDGDAQTALHQVELLQRISALDEDAQMVLTRAQDAQPTDVQIHLRAADIEFSHQRPDAAFARLLDVIRATTGDDREAARKRLLAYFDILGPSHETVVAARKALTNALF